MKKRASLKPGSTPLHLDLFRAVGLAALVVLIWCANYNRWTVESWQIPLTYHSDPEKGDVLGFLAQFKATADGHVLPFQFTNIPELGAPYVANWDDIPMPEKPLFCMVGLLARIFGLFAAANLAVMLGQVLAAVSFYAACRLLNYSWIWSFAAAVVFAFARYAFAHGLHHLPVLYYWHVPLCLVVVLWMIHKEGIKFGEGRFIFALVAAFITGVQNPYYANMFVQFILFAGLIQGWRHGWKSALPATAVIATTVAGFLMMISNTIFYQLVHGGNAGAVVRNNVWMEVYGLKLVDLVVPPPDHPFPPFASWGAAYLKGLVLSPGEFFGSGYLGLVGLAALAWLVITSVRRLLDQDKLPIEAWLILWIFLYAEVGGINGVTGTLGFQLFRSATRYCIFILCLVLMYAVGRLSSIKWKRINLAYGAAALLTGVALWDQMPPQVSAQDLKDTAQAVASDRDFTEKMEERLPPNAMVFQIPIMEYPESPVPGVGSYDHFRPYLYSHSLRFSFGSDKGRPEGSWQQLLAQVSFQNVVSQLESYGFSAIYIDRNGFADRGAGLIKTLQGMGYKDMIESDRKDLVCVFIKPSSQPTLPAVF